MLCDEWLAYQDTLGRRSSQKDLHYENLDSLKSQLGSAQRMAIAPDAYRVLWELVSGLDEISFDKARLHCIAPAYRTWVEWHCPQRQSRVGFLLEGETADKACVRGAGYIVLVTVATYGENVIMHLPITWDFAAPPPAFSIDPTWVMEPEVHAAIPGFLEGIEPWLFVLLTVAFALIATPRLTRVSVKDLGGVNKNRQRLGKPELLTHSEISLALGPDSDGDEDFSAGDCVQSTRARHHVRAHYRFTRGKIVLVRHHMRGDARNGIVRQSFVLRAAP